VALRLTGIPVYREGLHFVIPSGNWSVIEACSGVRYLIASVMTGVLFAYLHYRSMRRRLLFVAVSFVVPIIANWLRAYLIVLLGHYSDNRLASGIDHVIYGWVFFGVVIFAMFYVGSFWSDADGVKQAAPAAPRVAAAPRRRLTHAVAAAAAALLTLPHVAAWALDGAGSSEPPYLERPLVLSPAWTPVDLPVPVRWKPSFRNASAELQQVYRGPRGEVGLYLAYYRHQNFERKLVSTDNVLAKSRDPDWTQTSRGRASIDAGGRSLTVRTASLRHTPTFGRAEIESQITVRQFYWVNGTVTDNDYVAKGYGALQRLLGRGDDAAAVIVYAHHDAGTDADALLTSFLADNAALLDERLRRVRDGLLPSAALKPNNS
jgi:EpsI family protein